MSKLPKKQTAAASKPGVKKLGSWSVRRQGENQILITIPAGMKLQGDRLVIEDVLAAAANYQVVKKGRALACCSGNIAIA